MYKLPEIIIYSSKKENETNLEVGIGNYNIDLYVELQ